MPQKICRSLFRPFFSAFQNIHDRINNIARPWAEAGNAKLKRPAPEGGAAVYFVISW
jgi:hypothetical protein